PVVGGRLRWRSSAQYGHEILAHLARVAHALRDAEGVEEFQDLDREAPANARRVAVLRGGESIRARACKRVRSGGQRGERCARIEAVRGHSHDLAAAAIAA